MDRLIQNLTGWIRNSDKQLIIGISGHGAAGKTTFAQQLMDALKLEANYLNTDPYIVSSSIRKHSDIKYPYKGTLHHFKMTACHPAAHHIPSLERDIRMIREGLDLLTIETHYSSAERLSSENNVTIVEGMSVAFADPELFDLLIYFYTDGSTELERRFGRDIEERGTELEYLKQSHNERRIQYEVFMHPYSEHFDTIIKSTKEGTMSIEKNTFDPSI
ncbi:MULTISPECIES: uridine kinase family protein [Bhargavaea]|uniref:Uridine kinase n=1 Tax=Bhargavaea changchunensis TaxID=2134037 RepID=A0ABW2NG72_9BACL|nr:phosphoribulokinase [Bhargavaea sp. CC-171006]